MTHPPGYAERMKAACDLLAEPRRRFLLYQLADGDGRASLDDLAVRIAAWEREVPVEVVDEEAEQFVYVSMVHNHLPRLADYDVVEYDLRSDEVVLAEGFSDLESLLEQFRQTEAVAALRTSVA